MPREKQFDYDASYQLRTKQEVLTALNKKATGQKLSTNSLLNIIIEQWLKQQGREK
jgi:hypothetical protein